MKIIGYAAEVAALTGSNSLKNDLMLTDDKLNQDVSCGYLIGKYEIERALYQNFVVVIPEQLDLLVIPVWPNVPVLTGQFLQDVCPCSSW